MSISIYILCIVYAVYTTGTYFLTDITEISFVRSKLGNTQARTHYFSPPPWAIFAPPLALKMLLFYIKSTNWPLCSPIQGLYIIMNPFV